MVLQTVQQPTLFQIALARYEKRLNRNGLRETKWRAGNVGRIVKLEVIETRKQTMNGIGVEAVQQPTLFRIASARYGKGLNRNGLREIKWRVGNVGRIIKLEVKPKVNNLLLM